MKASELRIGNYIGIFSVPTVVYPQLILNLSNIELTDKIPIDISPIPLTEDWLLRFGFEIKGNHGKYWELNEVDVFVTDGKLENSIEKEIKYVHQLQNLYFALTGEELKLIK